MKDIENRESEQKFDARQEPRKKSNRQRWEEYKFVEPLWCSKGRKACG